MANQKRTWERLLSNYRLGFGADPGDRARSPFHRDHDRIVFSSAFRRLQDKTQVHPLPQSDYVRRRLTHSLEVSCVGRSLGNEVGYFLGQERFLPDAVSPEAVGVVVSAACLAHDIGNPPFGHAGEKAIARWCQSALGARSPAVDPGLSSEERSDLENFEGNAQGFRVLSRLQANVDQGGLQLTCAVLAAFTKYPCGSYARSNTQHRGSSVKKFGFFEADRTLFSDVADHTGLSERVPGIWMRHPLNFLVEAADDICFACVDLEDAFKLRYCSFAETGDKLHSLVKNVDDRSYSYFSHSKRIGYLRAKAIGQLVDEATSVFKANHDSILRGDFDESILDHVPSKEAIKAAKGFARARVFESPQVSRVELAGFKVIQDLMGRFGEAVTECKTTSKCSEIAKRHLRLLPSWRADISLYDGLLCVTDFISGMTDSYALHLYRDLNGIGRDSVANT